MKGRGNARILSCLFVTAAILASAQCGGSQGATTPTASLPLVRETAGMRYYHEPGDRIDADWQEIYNAWALQRLGVQVPRPVEYRKYFDRAAMGRYTGSANTNGFAEPDQWRFHSIWPTDNHEVVHVYSAIIGRPTDFFNEGLAVSFQTDPARGDFIVKFNGEPVHDACRRYLAGGVLPLPLSASVTTSGFRAMPDSILSYRMAGSFVLYLTERFGMPAMQAFMRGAAREDSLPTVRSRMQTAFGVSLEEAEADWLAMLRQSA